MSTKTGFEMKHWLALAYLIILWNQARGQDEPFFPENLSVFGKGGISYAGTTGWQPGQPELGRIVGLHVGLGYAQAINYAEDVWVAGEINYAFHGFKFLNSIVTEAPELVQTTYFNVPVYLKYYPFQALRSFYLGAGPQIGIRTDGFLQEKGGMQYTLPENDFPTVDFSGVLMAGFHLARKTDAGMEIRYQHGFTKIMREMPAIRQSVVQASVFMPASYLLEVLNVLVIL